MSSDSLMPIAIGIIMFGIGLNLKFSDFKRVFIKPRAILTGLACQLLLLPFIAFALIFFWDIAPVYKVGFILIASAPGGTASNLVTNMLRGRVALSVSLTSFNSFAILFTIPLFVNLGMTVFQGEEAQISLSFSNTFQEILYTVVLPVLAGVLTNQFTPQSFTDYLRTPLRYILPALLLGVFAYALFFEDSGQPAAFFKNVHLAIPLFLLNFLAMAAGYLIGRKAGIRHDGCYTIAVEMGLQNSALAIFIATSVLNSSEMSLVAVIYSSFSFFTTYGIAWCMKHFIDEEKLGWRKG